MAKDTIILPGIGSYCARYQRRLIHLRSPYHILSSIVPYTPTARTLNPCRVTIDESIRPVGLQEGLSTAWQHPRSTARVSNGPKNSRCGIGNRELARLSPYQPSLPSHLLVLPPSRTFPKTRPHKATAPHTNTRSPRVGNPSPIQLFAQALS